MTRAARRPARARAASAAPTAATRKTDGTAPASERSSAPSRCRNRSSERSATTVSCADRRPSRGHTSTTKARTSVTSPRHSSSPSGPSKRARTGEPCRHSRGRPPGPDHAPAPDTAESATATPRPAQRTTAGLAGGATPNPRRYPSSGSQRSGRSAAYGDPAARRAAQKRSATSEDNPDGSDTLGRQPAAQPHQQPACLRPSPAKALPRQVIDEPESKRPSGPDTSIADTSAISNVSSREQHVGDDLGQPVRLCTPPRSQ